MTKTIGMRSYLSTERFCSECGGALICRSTVSPIHFNHDPAGCSLADDIVGVTISDKERLRNVGAGARYLIEAERTLLLDRGATVADAAIAFVDWSGVSYRGVVYA